MTDAKHESRNVETARAYLSASSEKDYDTCVGLLADEYVFIDHSTSDHPATPEEMAQALADADAWTDKVFEIKRVFDGPDNTVVMQYTVAQTHSGSWRGIPATGKRATWAACILFCFDRRGRILSEEYYADALTVMRQIGL